MNKVFKYRNFEEKDGEKILSSEGCIPLSEIISSVKKDGVLYLFLRQETETRGLLKAPLKRKPTKDNPNEWEWTVEKASIKEPVTLQVTEADDIARWDNYTNSINI